MAAHEADAAPTAPLSDLLKADILEDAFQPPEESLIAGFADFSVSPETAPAASPVDGWDAFATDFPPVVAPAADGGQADLLGLEAAEGNASGAPAGAPINAEA
jgi:hypothetical protein